MYAYLLLDVKHCFEIRTEQVDYYIGEDMACNSSDGTHMGKSWETAIRQALMPVAPNSCKYNMKS